MLLERISEFFLPATSSAHSNIAPQDGVVLPRAPRTPVFIGAALYPIDVFCDAQIRDLSADGLIALMGETEVDLAVGQALHVTIDEQFYHLGIVKWTQDRRFALDLPNADAIFGHDFGDGDGAPDAGQHSPGLHIRYDASVRIVAGGPPIAATVRNLSSAGMLLDTTPGLMPGQHIVVKAQDMLPIYGRAEWTSGRSIGLKARHPISHMVPAHR